MQSNSKIKVSIVGASGYTGGELLRLLTNHPDTEIINAFSRSHEGKPVWLVHGDLLGDTSLKFSGDPGTEADVFFLCLGHGASDAFLKENPGLLGKKIIDLSQDFRLKGTHDFIYGLPEFDREAIRTAQHVANPGCFATAIQLALLPLAKEGLLQSDVHIAATTGSTGAGQSLSDTTHYSWRNNNFSAYKPFGHQHLGEIGETLHHILPSWKGELNFIPNRGSFTRGIYATVYTDAVAQISRIREVFSAYYAEHPFTHLSDHAIDVKSVVNTNKCHLRLEKHGGKLLIHSAIDNLLKGASGQAVQNMNLMSGRPETTGLKLKATAF
ncbi:MAG: N-acetyl-gamma-glutamyl-phosphate reductase [Bacteroidia bacterium]|nr:N-acetyl-gamma-glutamyl-phosphate reductase [Bacteroidia bacterium]